MKPTYKDKLTDSMLKLVNEFGFIIIGQGVVAGGHGLSSTIPKELHKSCIELPVFEETQTGVALGMALNEDRVISLYPRFDFFILGLNQFINHADKVEQMSGKRFNPNIIFRVGVGAKVPLDAGPQHTNNYTTEMRSMLTGIQVTEIGKTDDPLEIYTCAATKGGLHLIVEHSEYYNNISPEIT